MRLCDLIERLQAIEARLGGGTVVEVGLNHAEDGWCSKPLETVDDELMDATVILHGGTLEPVDEALLTHSHLTSLELRNERHRQEDVEGYAAEGDDLYTGGELALAAVAYLLSATSGQRDAGLTFWPDGWDADAFKPTNARRDLIKAGALIIAEIERRDRVDFRGEGPCPT